MWADRPQGLATRVTVHPHHLLSSAGTVPCVRRAVNDEFLGASAHLQRMDGRTTELQYAGANAVQRQRGGTVSEPAYRRQGVPVLIPVFSDRAMLRRRVV